MLGRLSSGYRVHALDPPGQGGTQVVDAGFGYDVDAIARSLGDFLGTVGLPTAAFVGHSWGGGFALRLADCPAQAYPLLTRFLTAPAATASRGGER